MGHLLPGVYLPLGFPFCRGSPCSFGHFALRGPVAAWGSLIPEGLCCLGPFVTRKSLVNLGPMLSGFCLLPGDLRCQGSPWSPLLSGVPLSSGAFCCQGSPCSVGPFGARGPLAACSPLLPGVALVPGVWCCQGLLVDWDRLLSEVHLLPRTLCC